MSVIKAFFPIIYFSIYDNLTSEHVPGQLKYDVCVTEQVSGPQGTKIAGRHMVMAPYNETDTESQLPIGYLSLICDSDWCVGEYMRLDNEHWTQRRVLELDTFNILQFSMLNFVK